MKVDMQLKLRDIPGSLLRAIEPISSRGGNIISVVHSRSDGDMVGVQVVFTVRDEETLQRIRKNLSKNRVKVAQIEVEGKRYYEKKILSFILVGHVIDQDIQDTIDRINELGLVTDVDVLMQDPKKKSSVYMKTEVDKSKHAKLLNVLDGICGEKDFLLIKTL